MLIDRSWSRAVDSLDDIEGPDLTDAEVEVEMEKLAFGMPTDERKVVQQHEFELWKKWKAEPTADNFEPMYASHQKIIQTLSGRSFGTTTLPKAALKSHILRSYIKAVETYEPGKAALTTHVWNNVKHARVGRMMAKFQNIGRIPEDRARLIPLLQNRESALTEQLGRIPSATELSDDMMMSVKDIDELQKTKISPRIVTTLRRELRSDRVTEMPGGESAPSMTSDMQDRITYIHGELSPEHKLVLEHTFEGWGKPIITDAMELSQVIGLSPQKIRAIKSQIAKKVEKYYGQGGGG